jgi:hypothetical protein
VDDFGFPVGIRGFAGVENLCFLRDLRNTPEELLDGEGAKAVEGKIPVVVVAVEGWARNM